MSGFEDMPGVAVDENGRADPQTQLFRSTAVGVTTGPMISQVRSRLLWSRQTNFSKTIDVHIYIYHYFAMVAYFKVHENVFYGRGSTFRLNVFSE